MLVGRMLISLLANVIENLHRDSNARTNLQKVLTEYGDSEFAGPAAFCARGRWRSQIKTTPRRFPAFFQPFRGQIEGTGGWRFRRVISKHAALKLSAGKTKPLIFTRRSPRLGIQIRIAKMHESRRHPSSPHGEKKLDALKQYEALANEGQKPALKAECAVRGGLIALELVQADKGKMDKAMADRAAALFQKGAHSV